MSATFHSQFPFASLEVGDYFTVEFPANERTELTPRIQNAARHRAKQLQIKLTITATYNGLKIERTK